MPYEIETRDGIVIRNIPDDVPPDHPSVKERVMKARGGGDQPIEPLINTQAALDTVADLVRPGGNVERFKNVDKSLARGVLDLPTGAGQLVSNVADIVIPGQKERYDDAMGNMERQYQESRGPQAGQADPARIAGNIITGMAATPTNVPATLAGRMKEGGKIGAALGATAPVEPDADNFWLRKLGQTGLSAAAGFLAPPVVEGLIHGASAVVNKLANVGRGLVGTATGKTTPQTIEAQLEIEFKRGGVDWKAVSQETRNAIVGEIQKALKAGGKLDQKAIERMAAFEKTGIQPTVGQVTRDPAQYALEQNLSKTEAGAKLAERFGRQNTQLIERVERTRAGTGAKGADQYEAGKLVTQAAKAKDEGQKAAVTAAYDKARNLAGVEADVPLEPIAQRLGDVMEEIGTENIPAAVMNRLKDFGLLDGKQTRVFNVREAEKLRKLIGNNMPRQNTPADAALTQILKAVDDSVNSLATSGNKIGAEAATAFGDARQLAAGRFGAIDKNPLLQNVLGKSGQPAAAEDVVEKFVVRGGIDEVANTLKQLPTNARSEVRAAVIDWIKGRAIPPAGGDTAIFSQAGFNRALETIGERKLRLIFAGDKEGAQMLQALAKVSSYMQKPPVSSGVNYSNSATTFIDFLDRATKFPLVGPLLGKPSDFIRATQAARATGPVAPVVEGAPVVRTETVRRLAPRAGLLAAPVGGVFALPSP
jgi:hypothetical protein